MHECTRTHDFGEEAWSEASRHRVGNYYQHWHPDTVYEIANWFQEGQDRVRDEQFDVVTQVEDADEGIIQVHWLAWMGWNIGDPVREDLNYYVSSEADIEKFLLLPLPSVSKQDVEDAIVSIRRTYDREA